MDILAGLLTVNGKDMWTTFGAFLCEDKQGDYTNYSELQKPPAAKNYTAVAYREENGEELPEELPVRFEARDVTLYFAIIAASRKEWRERYGAFVSFITSGWLNIHVPELDKTYKMLYKSCTQYTQLTPIEDGYIAAKLKVKLREPKPVI